MSLGRAAIITGVLCCSLAMPAPPARAQISPGRLSAPHSSIDGNTHCLECHRSGKGVDPELCLECHELLAERVAANSGLHASPGHHDCKTCHIEHQGAAFELVWWGEDGIEAFDHSLTGYDLAGAHAAAKCRDCHQQAFIHEPQVLIRGKKDLDRTFLGLDRNCTSCHEDVHRGEFEQQKCSSCHGSDQWKPVLGFDHDKTSFPLTGRHVTAACDSCHRPVAESVQHPADVHRDFRIASFSACGDCHRDPHEGRLGNRCQTCHSTEEWGTISDSAFDHGKTRFPLVGKHAQVRCAECHRGTGFAVARFAACADCHRDEHAGQFESGNAASTGCEACHTESHFAPSSFTVARHQETEYPLAGAHLAVACNDCHRPVRSDSTEKLIVQYRFTSTECSACHRNPHGDEIGNSIAGVSSDGGDGGDGCANCHSLGSWRQISFDHESTGFRLEGKHHGLGCRSCHLTPGLDPEANPPRGSSPVIMTGTSKACGSCHLDPHRDQFSRNGEPTACERCHSDRSWLAPLLFDHDRDSTYRLDGAHRTVPCAKCHRQEVEDGQLFVRYRPVPADCKSCHI